MVYHQKKTPIYSLIVSPLTLALLKSLTKNQLTQVTLIPTSVKLIYFVLFVFVVTRCRLYVCLDFLRKDIWILESLFETLYQWKTFPGNLTPCIQFTRVNILAKCASPQGEQSQLEKNREEIHLERSIDKL